MSKKNDSSRSWFCVLNNPQNLFGDISPDEMVNKAIDLWCDGKPARSCAVNYEIGDKGTPHMHMVLEDPAKTRFSSVQKLFNGIHIEPTKGNKEQAMDYIYKRGAFEEKDHTVVVPAVVYGEIRANRGKRKDLESIQDLIEAGYTPNEIMDMSIHYRSFENLIRKQFYRHRLNNTSTTREVTVYWHVGDSGCGKSYTYVDLCDKYGRDNVFLMNDYENGGFDTYCGEPVLFMDEFKGTLSLGKLLNILDKYPFQIHSRYANVYALWNEVHITSVYPPEEIFKDIVGDNTSKHETYEQLRRRISFIVYHYVDNGEFKSKEIPIADYSDYVSLRSSEANGFIPASDQNEVPFNH